jgi:general secretion pathway protein A
MAEIHAVICGRGRGAFAPDHCCRRDLTLYCEYFGLREKPFSMTPDPRFLFLSESHREALAHLLYGIDNRTGFIELTGEVGSGKTTVLRALLTQLDAERYRTALIFNPCLSAPDLLQAINREFRIPTEGFNQSSHLENLNRFLISQNKEGRIVVLVIDEAQNLQPEVLEQIRLISNLETDREKLLQIVLAGQPELGKLLERKDLRQLNQRIVVRYHLRPMTFHDTNLYIQHRLHVAGGRGALFFTREAARRIYRFSGGLPRVVNITSDRALLAAYTKNKRVISVWIALSAIADIKRGKAKRNWKPLAGATAAVGVLATVIFFSFGQNVMDSPRPAVPSEKATSVTAIMTTPQQRPPKIGSTLEAMTEKTSAVNAYDALAKAWKIKPLEGAADPSDLRVMERAAREAGLSLYWFSGNLGALLRLDCPAILELRSPGAQGKRYAALTGLRDGRILVDPPLAEAASLDPVDLEQYWSGRGLILWRNSLELPARLLPGASGKHVKNLQGLLSQAGYHRGAATGRFDGQTTLAVKEFQSSRGIEPDGIAGQQTQILLYKAAGRFEMPGLLR